MTLASTERKPGYSVWSACCYFHSSKFAAHHTKYSGVFGDDLDGEVVIQEGERVACYILLRCCGCCDHADQRERKQITGLHGNLRCRGDSSSELLNEYG